MGPGLDLPGQLSPMPGVPRRNVTVARRRVPTSLQALRHDLLVRNSVFIMLTTVVNSLLGFVFWVIAAHLYPTSTVGLAAAFVSAFSLAAVLANPAVHSGLTQVLPNAKPGREWSVIVNGGLFIGTVAAIIWGILLVPLLPLLSHQFDGILHNPVAFAGFVVGVIATVTGLIVDYLFVAERRSENMLWRNVAFGVAKIPLLLVAVVIAGRSSASGIWGVWALTTAVTVVLAIVIGFPRLGRGYILALAGATARWRAIIKDLAWHHATNLGLLLPMYVLPLLVVARVSSRANAYYYVTWMLCSVFFVVSPAISSALFAEGSHDPASVRAIARRSVVITSALLAIIGLGYVVLGPLVLRVFGPAYAANGTTLLLILVASAPFEAVNNIYVSVLRVERRLVRAAVLTAGMACISLALAWILLPTMGINGAGVAWLIAQFVGMVTTVGSVLLFDRRRSVPGSRGAPEVTVAEDVAPRVLDPAS